MEKQTLLGGPPSPRPQGALHPRAASRTAVFVAVVALWALLSWHFLTSHDEPRPRNTEPEFRVYPGESIRWRPCGDDGGAIMDLECGTVDVPMDHSAAAPRTDGTSKIFTVPLMRMRGRGGRSAKNLLLSPGGPGASGVAFMRSAAGGATALRRLVGDGFHLVAFDPRGVGASTPSATCYVSEASREQLRPRRATSDVIRDSPYLYAWSANYGRACLENAGEHLAYVNTPQMAADLNVVLDALGQKGMVYWGVGYGALLGEVYASMFPGRVERMVLDAVPDQQGWFEELLDMKRYADADAVVDGFFAECVRAGEAACTLARFGKTGPALRDNVTAVINSLYLSPKSVYVNGSVYGIVDDFAARISGLFREMHTPAHWPALAGRLADLQQGNATSMFLAYGRDEDDLHEAGLAVQLNDGRSGKKAWPQPRMRLLEKLLLYFDRRRFAIGEARALHIKQQWPVQRMHAYGPPRKRVKMAAPVLVLAATRDPAWPLQVARAAQEVFEGARLVALDAYGHGSFALPSLCVAGHLRDYLVNGSLPEENVVCKRDGEYFLGGGEKAAYSLEEREVLAAQRDLSEKMQANLY